MVEYVVKTDDDGKRIEAFKDGSVFEQDLLLEPVYARVKIFFQLANNYLREMDLHTDKNEKRAFGMQSFLMSLIGLEAFGNCYFHIRAVQKGVPEASALIAKRTSLRPKLTDLIELIGDGPLVEQQLLLAELEKLFDKRNEIAHPKWTLSRLTLKNQKDETYLTVNHVGENPNEYFESFDKCKAAQLWCLLFVLRVAELRKLANPTGFLYQWTGSTDSSIDSVLADLSNLGSGQV